MSRTQRSKSSRKTLKPKGRPKSRPAPVPDAASPPNGEQEGYADESWRAVLMSDEFSGFFEARPCADELEVNEHSLEKLRKLLRTLSGLTDLMEAECARLVGQGERGYPTVRLLHIMSMLCAVPSLTDSIMVCRNEIFPEDYEGAVGRVVFVDRRPDVVVDLTNGASGQEDNSHAA